MLPFSFLLQQAERYPSSMAFSKSPLSAFSWMCGGELDMGSFCIQRSVLDLLNCLFLSVFMAVSVLGSIRKHEVACSRRDWVSRGVSICCVLISIGYFIAGIWGLFVKNEGSSLVSPAVLVYFVRGLIWACLTVSLLARTSEWARALSSVWWVSFFLFDSALRIEILVENHSIQVLDMVPWSVNLLLLFCAFRNFCPAVSGEVPDGTVSEPLLDKDPLKSSVDLSESSFISKLAFSWINPLLRLGYSKRLVLQDIPPLTRDDEAGRAYRKFAHAWELLRRDKSSASSGNLVVRAMAGVYLKETVFVGICAFVRTIAFAATPLLLYAFVSYSNRSEEDLARGLLLVGCLVIAKVVESVTQRHWFLDSKRSGMRMRSALMVAVYQKQLRLSSLGRRRHSAGEIVNYVAVDAYRMGESLWWFHSIWSSVLQLFLSVGVLFGVVGAGALFGLVPILVCALINVPFAKSLKTCQTELMAAQDRRLRSTAEILNSMKVIKLQSWEDKFKSLVESAREVEFKWLAEAQYKRCYNTMLYWLSPTVISSVIFVGCALLGVPLNADTIFTIIVALRCMGEPVRMIPEALSALIQVKVSFDRLDAFLLDDELKSEEIRRGPSPNSDHGVKINAGEFSWEPESAIPTLKQVNLTVQCGHKVAVCGAVGAGKSSLLHAILGEIPRISGTVDVFGSIAYVSQTSWIQSGTIRANILYGKPMDRAKYERAIKACALDKDINSLDHGDETEIGQRGLNLSGGQKQRIQLARAVYNDADIYLLDDPFSAVDAHTAAILFKECVMTALQHKTVVLVTHQVEFLSAVDKILVMEGGQVTQSGSYEELLTSGAAFEQLVNAHKNAVVVLEFSSDEQQKTQQSDQNMPEKRHGSPPTKENSQGEISMKGPPGVQLTEEEETEIGDVGWKQLLDYFLVSNGMLLMALSTIAVVTFIALQAAATYWLALGIQLPNISNTLLIGVYAAISTLSAAFAHLRTFFGARLGLKASKSFFAGFTDSIFKAPMLFFDSTPVGRILTRASSDFSVLDLDIPFSLVFVVAAGLEVVSTIGILASVTWQVLIVAIFATIAAYYVQGYYLASARELIRINGTTKAPVMNYASETSLGVVTIRAFKMVERFSENYLELVDTDAKLFFYSNAAIEWLVLRIETLQNLTLITTALLLVLLPKGDVAPGLMGLSLSYAFALNGSQVFLTRWYCNLSNYVVSVERIKQFMHVPPEPPAIVEGKRPPSSWPPKGRIELQNLKIKYRPNAPLVLKGITCTFKEGTRVGVVGRTGSGKTTLISALFRLVEPESGKILVDGLDICCIGLKDLRMKLSIIPQEPTLFKGSIRTNLDPLGLYSDDEIWEALEKCQLKGTVSSLPNLLDSSVSDEGENWSAGQRQLFCLGRVLLKRNRILVLDEATASIDSATDAVLQRVIRQEFPDCTVITVAHRVPTVIDSDMVMVLSYGKLLEYDEPSNLMESDSSFSKLVSEYWNSSKNFNHYK